MLKQHQIYHALGANNNMLGCDRELFMLNLLISAALIFTSLDLVVTVISSISAFVLFIVLQHMGKKDLLLRHVYIRQLRYKPYYLAQATVRTKATKHYLK